MWASFVALLASLIEKIGVTVALDLFRQLSSWLMGLWQKKEQAQKDADEAKHYNEIEKDPSSTLEQKNAAEDKLLNS